MIKEQLLQVNLSKEELIHIISRYHFHDADFSCLERLLGAMLPLLRPKVYYEINPKLSFVENDNSVMTIVTLGNYIDSLENLYSEAGCLLEAYQIDCLSLALLEKAYQSAEELLHEASGLWINAYDFIGDQYPLETMPEILDYSGQTEVTCNSACMLQPKKSVVFIAGLAKTRREGDCTVCSRCRNLTCPNRIKPENPLSYGYQKIFGK